MSGASTSNDARAGGGRSGAAASRRRPRVAVEAGGGRSDREEGKEVEERKGLRSLRMGRGA